MILIDESLGSVETVELNRILGADNIDTELVESAKRTRNYPNVGSIVRKQYNLLKAVRKLNKPYERRIIGGK